MTVAEIVKDVQSGVEERGHARFSNQHLADLTPDDIAKVVAALGPSVLMQLPDHEVRFFDWLKSADPPVWKDIWEDGVAEPYLVSLQFLQDFCGSNTHGVYHIRDLQKEVNYYFAPQMFYEKESRDYLAAVKERFTERASLTTAQALSLEASFGPLDLWHFCFRNGVDLAVAKKAVQTLVDDKILVHVPTAEHLSRYFEEE